LHRIFFFTLPAFYLLVSAGLVKIKRYLAVGIIGLNFILITYSLKNYYENKLPYDYQKRYVGVFPKKDYKNAAIYVAEKFQEGDVILHICRSSFTPFLYYHRLKFPEFGIKLNDICKEDWLVIRENIYETFQVRTALLIKEKGDLSNYNRVWLIHSSWEFEGKIYLPNHDGIGKKIVDWFDKNFSREDMRMFKGINVYLFSYNKEVR